MNLWEVVVRPAARLEERRFQELMQEHHYLGCSPKINETLWYVALWRDQWVALLSFSAAAWKCAATDRWIGWNLRHQYDRLKLVVNNSRFLILPDWHIPNLGSRVLSLCEKRLPADWQKTFGHPLMMLLSVLILCISTAPSNAGMKTYGGEDESLAIDGKTMCNAIDQQGHQTHIMSVIGHQTKNCYTPKK